MGIFGSVLVVSFIRFCFGSVLVLTGPLILLAYNSAFYVSGWSNGYFWWLNIKDNNLMFTIFCVK